MRKFVVGLTMFSAGMSCCAVLVTEGHDLVMISVMLLTLFVGIKELSK